MSIQEYTETAELAIQAYCMNGRVSTAASLQKAMAEAFEGDYLYKEAGEAYDKAADLY